MRPCRSRWCGPRRRAAAALLQGVVDVAARRQPGRQDAEQDAGQHRRARGEGEHGAIEGHRQARLPGDLDARGERTGGPGGDQQAEAAAGEPEQHAFEQRLADQAQPRRPERGVQGEVAGPADVAGQLQVGQVGAGDQQHARRQPHREPGQQADRRIGSGRGQRQDGDAALTVRPGEVAREPGRDRAHARLRGRDGGPGVQAADDGEEVAAAVLPRLAVEGDRSPRLDRPPQLAVVEAGRHPPTTVTRWPSSRTSRPTIVASPAKRRRQ